MGVEEPLCLIHAPNESVDPTQIEHMALAEALFLEGYGAKLSALALEKIASYLERQGVTPAQ